MTLLADIVPTAQPTFGVASVMLVAWLPLAIALTRWIGRPNRALIATMIGGWLFLPQGSIVTPFVIYDKSVALEVGMLLGMFISYPRALRPKLKWIDWPMIAWCLVPGLSALSNGLSPYDAAAALAKQTLDWGVPYALGRVYLTTWADARALAIGIFVGGLVYAPLCILESIASPFLHNAIYGFYQHGSGIEQSVRGAGWRPMVFLQHGLAVGMFMVAASLMGGWLWWSGSLRRVARVPVLVPLVFLVIATVDVRSTGALALFPIGVAALYLTQRFNRRVLLIALLLIPPVYITSRAATQWNGDNIISYAMRAFGSERAESLAYRLYNERRYLDHDREKPLLGFGPGPSFLVQEEWGPVVVDSLWIIVISVDGIIGMVAVLLCFAAPVAALLWRIPARQYAHPAFASAIALAVLLLLYGLDNLANAMFNPIFVTALGCLGALTTAKLPSAPRGNRSRRRLRRGARPALPPRQGEPRVESLDHFLAADTLSLDGDSAADA